LALILADQGADVTGKAFGSLEQCLADGSFTEAECNGVREAAQSLHQDTAPRYDSSSVCEAQHGFGGCTQAQNSSGSFWTPFLAGFFVNQLIDRATGDGWADRTRPLMRGGDGSLYTPGGFRLGRSSEPGNFKLPKSAVDVQPAPARVQTRTSVAARGGFGARSSGRGFGFGG
jgi:uncharacterized protein YgiB involved in biofilm formation